ncbi:MAG: TolC family protein [Chlorobia bacterium]|nr:TolC family protein [Fimbriimonadaceae bacterium]
MTFLINFAAIIAVTQGGETLTIEQAVDIATKNAFAVRQQASAVEKNRQRVKESEGGLGPRVTISGTYTRFEEAQTAEIAPGQSIITQPIDTKQAVASLNFPIDISGNIGRIVRASKATLLASQQTLEATRNDVKLAVRRSYLAVLRAEEQIEVSKLAVQEAEERLKNAKIEQEAGTKAKIDVIRIEAQLAQAQFDLISATNQQTLAKQSLNNSLGRPIETDFTTSKVMSLPATPTADVADIDKAAQASRPEAKALTKTQEALAFIRRATERGTNPSMNLAINHQRNIDAQGFTAQEQTTTGAVTLNFPIFDSGVTRAQVKQARQDEEQVKIQLEQVRLGISLEVRQAITNMINSAARLTVAQRQLAAAEENYRISKVRLAAGEGITLEITDALTQLTQARIAVVSARYDYWTAYSELQRAVGTDDLQQILGGRN